jgi:hypothetical protein
MENPEKLTTLRTQDTRRRQTQQKHNTIYVGHYFTQANTNNVNKTYALLQTTGGKDEPNIVTDITTRNSERRHIIEQHKTKQITSLYNYTVGVHRTVGAACYQCTWPWRGEVIKIVKPLLQSQNCYGGINQTFESLNAGVKPISNIMDSVFICISLAFDICMEVVWRVERCGIIVR